MNGDKTSSETTVVKNTFLIALRLIYLGIRTGYLNLTRRQNGTLGIHEQ